MKYYCSYACFMPPVWSEWKNLVSAKILNPFIVDWLIWLVVSNFSNKKKEKTIKIKIQTGGYSVTSLYCDFTDYFSMQFCMLFYLFFIYFKFVFKFWMSFLYNALFSTSRHYQSISSVPCLLHRVRSVCQSYINLCSPADPFHSITLDLFSNQGLNFLSLNGKEKCEMFISVQKMV